MSKQIGVRKQKGKGGRKKGAKGASPIDSLPHLTPLLRAIANKDLAAVKMIVESGADINEANIYRFTPLIAAIYHGQTEIVRYLLEQGADPELVGSLTRQTPLSLAKEWWGKTKIWQMLKEKSECSRQAT